MTTVKPSRRRSAASAVASARSIRSIAAPRGAFDRVQRQAVRVLDIGKIDLRLDGRHRLDEGGANRVALAAQRAAGDPLRLSPLRLGFRLDQIGKPFDFRQIDLAIDERAPGEFSRFGKPQSGNSRKRLNHRGGDGPSAGDADFRHLFAGEAARRLEPGDQGPVERLPGARAPQGDEDSAAVRKFAARRNRLERGRTAGAGNPQNRDCRAADPGRRGEDRIALALEHLTAPNSRRGGRATPVKAC